ncbi:MAG: C1 family peptidase [Candidatus Acidiferrales bacterium]
MPRHSYGWVRDLPDQRDFMFAAPVANMAALPPNKDLRPGCPKEVYDQGQLGSCTANAIAGALEFDQIKQADPTIFTPSRLFIYYNERVIEGTVSTDSGAQIRDGIKCVGQIGACPETDWAYDITKFAQKPPAPAFQDAKLGKALQYQRVPQVLSQMKGCLASGYPFVFGFTVYESFESDQVAKTGVAPMPAQGEKVLGGHAVLAVGYDDASQRFIVRNSWGPVWGMGGYFTFPYAYLTDANLSDDFWTVRLVAKRAAEIAAEKAKSAGSR